MARYTTDPEQRSSLEGLVGTDDVSQTRFRNEVLPRGRSLIDLLEDYPACAMPFEVFLDRLPPLRPRYYSISSPLVSPDTCSITTGVLRGPARSGIGEFNGVCSTYLESNAPNSTVFAFVREPTISFRPPDDPQVPMIMIGAGTGLAPFRGFLQERAAQRAGGASVATSLLFFGCRTSADDYLYRDELSRYEADRVVKVEAVFSREGDPKRRYVQDAIVQRRRRLEPHPESARQHLRVRQRQHHGAWCSHRTHPSAPNELRSRHRRQQLARRVASRRPLPRGHLGRLMIIAGRPSLDLRHHPPVA
jgi:cytochrome P450/NADPH-cytochrome P450 reductase